MMDNGLFNASLSITDRNPMVLEAASSHIFSQPIIHSDAPEHDSRRQIIDSYPLFSTLQEEVMNNFHITNHDGVVNCETPVSRHMPLAGNTSAHSSIGNTELQEPLMENSLSATSLANLLSASSGLQENLIGAAVSSAPAFPPEEFRNLIPNDSCNTLNSSLLVSVNCAYGSENDAEIFALKKDANLNGQHNFRWHYDEIMGHQVFSGRTMSTVRPSYHVVASSELGWFPSKSTLNSDNVYNYRLPSNELSLSLGSCQPSMMNMPGIPDQCSEISCSGVTQVTSKDNRYPDAGELQVCSCNLRHSLHDVVLGMGLGSVQTFPNNEQLSLDCGSSRPVNFSHMMLGSRYLLVAQQVLAEVASYALQNPNELDDSLGGMGSEARLSFSSSCSSEREISLMGPGEFPRSSREIKYQGHMELPLQRHEPESQKSELLTMLQMIDRRYNQCIGQIQNVISAYHDATNSGTAQMPARFALHSISVLYKNLRERITSQILSVSRHLSSECMNGKEKSFESSFIQKQWALQQLRRNDQQSWRPQRGLPEKSVSILRAWMFQNFLHPYPKDKEKHSLAMKSGLTRSQVSNWFINARVRLWKPMIEEMYSEINKKKRTEEGTADLRNHGNNGSKRIQMS